MQIDWFTVAAQIINFLILVWLLQRYLYRPIVIAMDSREQGIATRLQEAAELKIAADHEAMKYRSERDALDRDKELLLGKARQEADVVKRALEDSARREVEERRLDWLRQLETERRTFLHEMRRHSNDTVMSLARHALKQLADARLEQQIAAVFAKHLEELERPLQRKIAKACQDSGGVVTVRTRFELPADEQQLITRTIRNRISESANVTYQRSESAPSGIQLTTGSQTVAWTLESYLDDLERRLGEELNEVVPHAQKTHKP